MSRKKILSLTLALMMLGNPMLSSISYAMSDYSESDSTESEYTSSVKIQKFLGWEQKVLTYMTKDFKNVAKNLSNIEARKAYALEFSDVRDNVQNVFREAEYSSDYMFASHIASLKKEIEAYKSLRKEIATFAGTALNPFVLSVDEVVAVENDTIDLQKVVTEMLRKAIDTYDTSDIKETGKMNIQAEGSFGKVDIAIEKYTKILSLFTASQEADMVAKATFTLNMPGSYEYDEATEEYVQSPGKTVTGDMKLDVSMKIVGHDLYLTLADYAIHTNLTGDDAKALDMGLKTLATYKGKTLKVSLPTEGTTKNINQAEVLAEFKKVLDVLETKSLLTPAKKIGDIYTMTLKDETLQAIGTIYGEKIGATELKEAKKEIRKLPLLYSRTDGKKVLFVNIHENDAVGKVSLEKKDTGYSFVVDVANPKKSGEVFHARVEKDFAEAKLTSAEVNMSMLYKDNNLTLDAEGMGQNIQVRGPLSEENTNIDFSFNGKKIGNMTWKKTGDTYTYDVLFELSLLEALSKFHMNGETTITKGNFPIVAPKDFVEQDIESLFQAY